jgi:CDP-diacylglycerol--glycerol-3-phosphate 3-phosphatidyltransferase
MFRHVPNLLTGSRLLLAAVFFVMLSYYQYEGRGDPTFLGIASLIYLVALVTDFLDGYLARKWNVEGVFGRIVDPFVDKILVLGTFIFFAGKNFIIPETVTERAPTMVVRTLTGVAPGIVIILLARELLVTTLRSLSESGGQSFGAAFSGKLKMVFQSVTIMVILVYVNCLPRLVKHNLTTIEWLATWVRDLCIWATVAITIVSGLLYVRRAGELYRLDSVRPAV